MSGTLEATRRAAVNAAKLLVRSFSPLDWRYLGVLSEKYGFERVHGDADFKGRGAYSDVYFVGCFVAYLCHLRLKPAGLCYDLFNLSRFKLSSQRVTKPFCSYTDISPFYSNLSG